jgi:hypothetical protein
MGAGDLACSAVRWPEWESALNFGCLPRRFMVAGGMGIDASLSKESNACYGPKPRFMSQSG